MSAAHQVCCMIHRSEGHGEARHPLRASLQGDPDWSRSPLALKEAEKGFIWQSHTCLACSSVCSDWTWACRACFCCCSSAAAAVAEASAVLRWLFTLCCSARAAAVSATCSADQAGIQASIQAGIQLGLYVQSVDLLASTSCQSQGARPRAPACKQNCCTTIHRVHTGCFTPFQLSALFPA